MNEAYKWIAKDRGFVMSMLADYNTLTTIALLIALTALCGLGPVNPTIAERVVT